MAKVPSKLFVAGLLSVLPACAQSASTIRVCVNSNNCASAFVMMRAKGITSQMFASAGIAVEWHYVGFAACRRDARQTGNVILDFTNKTPPSQHPGAFAFAQIREAAPIVILFDRIEEGADGPIQVSTLLAHVMTHEITHVLQGIARHSQTGLMKAHWDSFDFALMAHHFLPFASEDIDLIHRGLARRAGGTDGGFHDAFRSVPGARMPDSLAPRPPPDADGPRNLLDAIRVD